MKIAGIIAEYNPFHKGHAYHIQRTRELSGCDYVVVCMAGHFTQRAEPACMSKWARVRMALSCGADAVFELPAMFTVRPADAFARGGVHILADLGVDLLSFGSETEDMALLRTLAGLRTEEPQELSLRIREKLDAGMSHARARGEAVGEYLGMEPSLLNRPNLILAAEYLRAMKSRRPDMEALAVRRLGDYHDAALGEYASASAIRAAFSQGNVFEALQCIPEAAWPYARPDALHSMDDILMFRLRSMPLSEMADLPDMGEGLEHRLYRLCRETSGREELLEALKCKRYTRTRLSRLLLHALLQIRQADLAAYPEPGYLRLLGVRRDAKPLLRELSRRACRPMISVGMHLREDACFALECRATDLWALLHDAPEARLPGREYTEKFVQI